MPRKHIEPICAKLATGLLLFGLLGFGGCTVGPNFDGVATKSLPANFLNSPDAGSLQSSHLPPRPQWHRFGDPKLNQLIENALVESPSVKEMYSRIRESSALFANAPGQRNPLSFLRVSCWEIDLTGRIRRETEAARAEYKSTVADFHDVRRLLVGEIARTYIRVRLFQDLQYTTRQNLNIQGALLGQVGELDRVQLQSRLGLTESDLPFISEQLKLALNQLAVLAGTTPSRQFFDFVGYGPQLTDPLIDRGIPADLIRYRPDIRRSEQDVAAETARAGIATAKLYPRLNLLGTISADARNHGSLLSSDSLAFAVGPSLIWNILSLGRTKKSIEAQKARVEQAIQRYQQNVLTAVGEVENSLVSYHENAHRSVLMLRTVQNAGLALELSENQYKASQASLEQVISSQRRLLEASTKLAETRAAVATASVDLIQATGVGWGGPGTVTTNTVTANTVATNNVITDHGTIGTIGTRSQFSQGHVQGHTVIDDAHPVVQGGQAFQGHHHSGVMPSKVAPSNSIPVDVSKSLDQPVEGDSDGKTELLPPPKSSSMVPVSPTRPIRPTISDSAANTLEYSNVESSTSEISAVENDILEDGFAESSAVVQDGFDPGASYTPWEVFSKRVGDLPSIDDLQSAPPLDSATATTSDADASPSSNKWKNFRPDPERDWYAAPRATEK